MTQIAPMGNADSGFSTNASEVGDTSLNTGALPMLTIASHPNPSRIGDYAFLHNLSQGGNEFLSRHQMSFCNPVTGVSEPLNDPFLSRDPLIFSLDARGDLNINLMKSRTECKLDGLPMVKSRKVGMQALAAGLPLVLAERITLLLHRGKPWDSALPKFGLVGEGSSLSHLCKEIQRVVELDMTILLHGELGSGKEIVARAIHENGHRGDRPFVVVKLREPWNSSSASKWFGSSGSTSKTGPLGYFPRAHRGTLFLDEIARANLDLQRMLLRVLETGKYLPEGASTPRRIDFRVIAATKTNLAARVKDGKFLEPLYQRLTGYVISVPSLRERREDIGRLFESFSRQIREELGLAKVKPPDEIKALPWLAPKIMQPLLLHAWPGNMRQLRKLVRLLMEGNIGKKQLHWTHDAAKLLGRTKQDSEKPKKPSKKKLKFTVKAPRKPEEISEEEMLAALKRFRWNFKAAAAGLGLSLAALYHLTSKSPQVKQVEDISEEELRAAWASCKGNLDQLANYFSASKAGLRHRLKSLSLE